MARVIQATWDDFERVATASRERFLVCTPYYSARGLRRLSKALPSGVGLTFMSRISPSEWASGVSHPDELARHLFPLRADGRPVCLIVHQQLHAKAYLADCTVGLVGSANLSSAGFDKNFEVMLELTEDETLAATKLIHEEAERSGRPLTLDLLDEWVSTHAARIAQQRETAADSQDLVEAQRELDRVLGYGQSSVKPGEIADIDDFGEWLTANRKLAGASVLHDRYSNVGYQNLTGHFRQCYYAACRFLWEYDEHIGSLAAALTSMGVADIFQPSLTLLENWVRHLDDHATSRTDDYDYAVLRGILPPNLGGTRIGGGGGSSTLKRMLPLVARFIQERGA